MLNAYFSMATLLPEKVMLSSPLRWKQPTPIVFTPAGMATVFKFVQRINVDSSSSVSWESSANVIVCSRSHLSNALCYIT